MSDQSIQKNILAIKHHSDQSRVLIRDMENLMTKLKQRMDMMELDNRALRQQVQTLQIKIYSGGATA